MIDEITQQLKKTVLFRELNNEALSAIANKAATRELAKDEVLIRKGDEGDSLFLVHSGRMKIVTEDSKGEELIINICGPGEVIGEMALIDKVPRSATVIALEDVEVFELKHDTFEGILKTRPDVSLSIIRNYSSRLRFSTTYIERAIDWAQKIAEGDYSFIEDNEHDGHKTSPDDDKAEQLLSEFFKMVEKVKEREDGLKEQLEKLSFEIDQARRKKEFEEITGTEFYAQLKEQARELRKKRLQD